jgi:AcrR family transcriptional regulator
VKVLSVIGTAAEANTGPVAKRREAKVAAIVAAAWDIAREHGIAGLSLRELAGRVGMRQPSLYAYFASKDDLYDAMFADGNRQLIDHLRNVELPRDPRASLKVFVRAWLEFAQADLARCSLLFQRHLPGFTPSPAAYALAQEAFRPLGELAHSAGVTDQGDIDCIVAVAAGLMEAQIANDPTGDRWLRHTDRLIDLLVDDALSRDRST